MIPLLYLRGDAGEVLTRNFTPELSINRRIGLNNMMSISESYENTKLILHYISDVHLETLSFNYLTTTFNYTINSLDNKHFPNRGTKLNFSASTSKLQTEGIKTDTSRTVLRSKDDSFSHSRFYTFQGTIDHYFSPSGKLTWSIGGDVLFITNTDSVSAQNNFYLLGGVEPVCRRSVQMVGFQPNEIAVEKLVAFRSTFDFEPVESFHLNFTANIAAIQEIYRKKGYSFLTGIGIGAGYMSIIGPIKIGLMYGNYTREKYFNKIKGYISIGFNF
jgi:outer membrane translocation and assembly module TamA